MGTRERKQKLIGRPVTNPGEGVKSKIITMRTTPVTHKKLHDAAAARGLSLSEWLIGLGLRAAEKR